MQITAPNFLLPLTSYNVTMKKTNDSKNIAYSYGVQDKFVKTDFNTKPNEISFGGHEKTVKQLEKGIDLICHKYDDGGIIYQEVKKSNPNDLPYTKLYIYPGLEFKMWINSIKPNEKDIKYFPMQISVLPDKKIKKGKFISFEYNDQIGKLNKHLRIGNDAIILEDTIKLVNERGGMGNSLKSVYKVGENGNEEFIYKPFAQNYDPNWQRTHLTMQKIEDGNIGITDKNGHMKVVFNPLTNDVNILDKKNLHIYVSELDELSQIYNKGIERARESMADVIEKLKYANDRIYQINPSLGKIEEMKFKHPNFDE